MVRRMFVKFFIPALLGLAAFHAQALTADQLRAQAHLDAARALIKPDPAIRAANKYVQLAGLEHRVGRDKQAREAGYMIRGLMQEDTKNDKDDYLRMIARIQLDTGQTENAVNTLESTAEPDILTQNLQLEAAQQLTKRFGLQRGVTYARQAFASVMMRTDVYRKLCYTLAANGQADTALEFIEVTFDLLEIYEKLDAYRFAAYGLHTTGDIDRAAAILEDAVQQVQPYAVATTRSGMFTKLALTFCEIGRDQRGMEVLALAEAAAGEITAEDFSSDGAYEKIAEAYAVLGHRDQALQWIAKTRSGHIGFTLSKRLVDLDLYAGNTERAKQFSDETRAYFGTAFDVRVAMALLQRGDTAGALAGFIKLTEGFSPDKWHREAAAAFARKGQHDAIATLLPKIEKADDQFNFHLGAAEGYLGD